MTTHFRMDQYAIPNSAMATTMEDLPDWRSQESGFLMRAHQPLELLDLPLDILQVIVREVTHTNDLTALALTNSTLHKLAVPRIYSRFDIVWPDTNAPVDSRSGVDALTYGLATLVMGPEVFGEMQYSHKQYPCLRCEAPKNCLHTRTRMKRVRRGNNFAQYTRKFSLGNGPEDWVKEYLITKEAGKMLGTLVALAVGRMRNLETFVWDMPTGVLRDVWLALASLADREDEHECKLKHIWIRWHDNQEQAALTSTETGALPTLISTTNASAFQIPSYPRAEFPTFSILPAVKSLTVLDIDEVSYAEEMSVLIQRSLDCLEELRVGLAVHAKYDTWARARDDKSTIGTPLPYSNDPGWRHGGLLGILVSQFCSLPNADSSSIRSTSNVVDKVTLTKGKIGYDEFKPQPTVRISNIETPSLSADVNKISSMLSAQNLEDEDDFQVQDLTIDTPTKSHLKLRRVHGSLGKTGPTSNRQLSLHTLELERICLSATILVRAFDWSRLTSLTLLDCRNHEALWKGLRKKFTPAGTRRESSTSVRLANRTGIQQYNDSPSIATPSSFTDYTLRITKIQTDGISNAFLAFIKDTLAPDTLECLFLQQSETCRTSITIDQIYRCAIKRHRNSLKRLLIDSDVRVDEGSTGVSWRKWAFSRELITCITSGRMQLRELSMSIDYKDWHYFLQRLPDAASLRSLHIMHIADHVNGRYDSRDTAQQIVDVVALRPELELCYVAIQKKCFEILELSADRLASSPSRFHVHQHDRRNQAAEHSAPNDSDLSEDQAEEEDEVDSNGDSESELDEGNSNYDSIDEQSENDTPAQQRRIFKLREIIFYEDKVSIFKARHGKL